VANSVNRAARLSEPAPRRRAAAGFFGLHDKRIRRLRGSTELAEVRGVARMSLTPIRLPEYRLGMVPPLSPEDLRQFHDDGFVRLPAAFDPTAALAMQDFMWEYLTKQGIHREDRSTWSQPRAMNKTSENHIYDAIAGDRLVSAADQLLGVGTWKIPKSWGAFLITFPPPNPPPWNVTHVNWHWDGDCWSHLEQWKGLFIFTFFSSVRPRGGGTLVATGTHRLLSRFVQALPDARKFSHSKLRPKFWASHPWLTALAKPASEGEDRIARFMDRATDIDGISARVVELTGEPGDAVICHPSLLHAASHNGSDVPRFMRVKDLRREKAEQATGAY
jgi:Phytanoyl-CoA dioxygenase (PhyH)